MPVERSAGAVIFRREKGKIYYLLLHYESGHWSFPKGNIEKGEKLKETVKREVEEETGIEDIKFINGFKETIKYFYQLKGKDIFKTVVYFLAETKKRAVKLSFEHIGFKWLSYDVALDQLTFKNSKEVLKRVNDFLKNPKIQQTIF
ncbi:MAG: bis(5'-nucleosyl)-tetraphosphatase [Candidatus Paceibacterales bacterium]